MTPDYAATVIAGAIVHAQSFFDAYERLDESARCAEIGSDFVSKAEAGQLSDEICSIAANLEGVYQAEAQLALCAFVAVVPIVEQEGSTEGFLTILQTGIRRAVAAKHERGRDLAN